MCANLHDIKLIHNGRQNSLVPRPSRLPVDARRAGRFLMCNKAKAQSSSSDTNPCDLIAHKQYMYLPDLPVSVFAYWKQSNT